MVLLSHGGVKTDLKKEGSKNSTVISSQGGVKENHEKQGSLNATDILKLESRWG